MAPPRQADGEAQAVGIVGITTVSALAVIAAAIFLGTLAYAEHWLGHQARAFAVVQQDCERIGGKAYRVNTIAALESARSAMLQQLATRHGHVCAQLGDITRYTDEGIERYLDWYFSLSAEWVRLAAMLSGGADELLQAKLHELVVDGRVRAVIGAVRQDIAQERTEVAGAMRTFESILERNRLVLDDAQCRVVKRAPERPLQADLSLHAGGRLFAGAGAGLAAGAFAGTLAAKAMGKASLKAAGKVLAKAVAKKALSKTGAAAAGAVLGSVIPGMGTIVGAATGFVIGAVMSTAVDWALLLAEEKLTREAMRKDLRLATREALGTLQADLGCR